jgi:hypothetical protein
MGVKFFQGPLIDRFWSKVEKTDSCWLWTAGLNSNGYGQIGDCGRGGRKWIASRLSWIIHFGNIPDHLCVLHKCDNRKCVNPDHLFLGTVSDNQQDMQAKKRSTIGERNPMAKLTRDKAQEIKSRRKAGSSLRELASAFGVCDATISMVARDILWKND